ncbi:hypothetical protein VST7929_01455 [Vibrio stylophorae]|uniref:DUF4336 domain-containing protein n=1 Tax=Vibrio stylophorae TaxID=659351 RepID=A0ABM8ZTD9_9VIBR|nr:DUF4336 domain-containing protein [Vibrio stylophorae]CAH0533585.1 hypothetical protein VST7929_01455 [Vibrio stylophorae]
MNQLSDHVWVFNGKPVTFMTLPFTTRMTIVKLSDTTLWVHSPIKLTAELKAQVNAIGKVQYLIAPNHLHHLFLKEWQATYPEAKTYGTQEVIKKRADLSFTASLTSDKTYPWSEEIDSLLFTGSPLMQESVFFHRASKSLILTDLIENFPPSDFTRIQRMFAKVTGILAPNGQTPIDWRMSFLFHKKEARKHYLQMASWQPQRIILAHGEIIHRDAVAFLERSFRWLNLSSKHISKSK